MSTKNKQPRPVDSEALSGADSATDPMAAREAGKYEFPVPSREAVLAHLTAVGEPQSLEHIAEALHVEGERDLESFARRLRAMERDGQILRNRRGRYGLVTKMDMVVGRVIGHPDGFGFLTPDDGGDDLFISPREMRMMFHGDRAMACVTGIDQRGRKEGSIVEVLERRQKTLVGRYSYKNGMGLVVPEDRRINQEILIPQGQDGGARESQIVMAEIVEYPTRRSQAVGRIAEVIGDHMAPGMEIEIAMRKYELPFVWPDDVAAQAAALSATVAEGDKQGREDLRKTPLVTIDGADARDFDDAVFCERVGRRHRLIVAIADVAHYVRPGQPLDNEAYRRGNSVYFPQNVIPMLPEVLSNGLCSLRPEVDRLCVACEMWINARGKVEEYRFFNAVMHSHARLTYDEVAAMLVGGDVATRKKYQALVPHLEELYGLFKILLEARKRRGAIDFELPETRIIYNAERKIERIEPLQRNDAHKLIEECMLAANVSAADFLQRHEAPVLYRNHAGPTPEKLLDLRKFLFEFGLKLGGGDKPSALDYAKLLNELEPGTEGRLVHTMLLRSLSQAVYSPDNIGHFALAYPNYTHFTSPIRRYPDLLVHRAIKAILTGKKNSARDEQHEQMKLTGEQCSMTERRADDATRDVIRWLKAEFMMDKVGQTFAGIISGVTGFGLFVELAEIYVDGLVHISALGNDYYHFDPSKQRLIGEHTNQVYRLGDSVTVKLMRVDLDEGKLDFELVAAGTHKARAPARRQRQVEVAPVQKEKEEPRKPRRGKGARAGSTRSSLPKGGRKTKSKRRRSRR